MGTYRLERGLVVQIDGQQFEFNRQLDSSTVQFENVRTGAFVTFQASTLTVRIAKGEIRVIRDDGAMAAPGSIQFQVDASNKVSLVELSDAQVHQLNRRYQYVMAMRKRGVRRGQRRVVSCLVAKLATVFGDPKPPSESTILRWMKNFEESGAAVSSLVSGNILRKKKTRLDAGLREIIVKHLKERYFTRNGESIRSVWRRILTDNQVQNMVTPSGDRVVVSDTTVRRIVLETDPYHRDRIRFGATYAAAKWRHSIGGVYATRPMQRIEMDHTLLDLYVIDDRRGIPLGRPTVTVLIDGYSGYILALYISFEGTTIGRLAQSIKLAILPKDELVRSLNLTHPWHSPGLWETLVVDNGRDFHSAHLKRMSMDLSFEIEYCPVRKPWFKPRVERAMLEMARTLPIAGRPEKLLGVKDVIDPKKTAVVMFSHLCSCLTKWAVDVHPQAINERTLARPLDLLLDGLKSMPAPSFSDDLRSLDIISGVNKEVAVRHSGIEHMYLAYRSPELADMAKQIAPAFRTNIKVNLSDLGAIWVEHPKDKSWISVPAVNKGYANGLSQYQHTLIRKHAKESLKKSNAIEDFLRAQSELNAKWDDALRIGKRSKANAKKLAQFEGLSSLAPGGRTISGEPLAAEQVVTPNELLILPEEIPTFDSFNIQTQMR